MKIAIHIDLETIVNVAIAVFVLMIAYYWLFYEKKDGR